MSETNTLPEGITQDMIDDAKSKFNRVSLAQLPNDDEGTSFFNVLLREPSRAVIGQYQLFTDKSPNKAQEILVVGCVIDKEAAKKILANAGLFLAAIDACSSMIPNRKSIVKNL
jgi:hypothetical protein